MDNSAQIFNALSDVPGDVQDVDELIEVMIVLFLDKCFVVMFSKLNETIYEAIFLCNYALLWQF